MKILLYGGTFDPPHCGHLNNLRAAAAAVHPEKIIVMPAGTPPHKAAAGTPGALRLAMCACFKSALPQGKDAPEIEISDWEIRQGGRSYTVNTLEMLRQKYPAAELYLCVGSDMLTTFTGWYRWQDILRMAVLVVESRTPDDAALLHEAAATLKAADGTVIFAEAPPLVCSSTAIRGGEYTPEQLQQLLPPMVAEIIKQNNLYNLDNVQ